MDLGRVFGRIWGGSWGDPASFLAKFWKDLGKNLHKILEAARHCFKYFLNWDPCAASLHPFGHSIRSEDCASALRRSY